MRLSRIAMVVALAMPAIAPVCAAAQTLDPWTVLRASEDAFGAATAEAVEEAVDPSEFTDAAQEAVAAGVPLRRTSPDIDPYAPLGIRARSFILYPSLETTAGYSTNGTNSAGGAASGYATVTPQALITSDWARHETTLLLRGSYETFANDSIDDEPTATIEGTARLDLADEWAANLAAGYHYEQQSLSDPNYPAGVDDPPGVNYLTRLASLRGRLGLNVVEAEATLDRTIYENGMSGGAVVDQSDRDSTEIGGRLRYGIAVTPLTTPFVEGGVARRIYDQKVDDDGVERSSWNYGLRAGLAYQSSPVLEGEFAIGYAISELDDPALSPLKALTFDGSLVWSPTELTTVAAATTSFDPSTDPASSGSVIYDAELDIAYKWRRNVTIDGLAGIQYERFEGTEGNDLPPRRRRDVEDQPDALSQRRLSARMARQLGPGDDYSSDSVQFTLRLRR